MPPSFCLTKYKTASFNVWDFWCAYVDRLCVQDQIDQAGPIIYSDFDGDYVLGTDQNYIKTAGPIIYPDRQSVPLLDKNLINIEQGAVKQTSGYESEKYVSDFNQKAYDFMNTPKNADKRYTASHRFPTVNITAPDDVLINSFMEWVNKERKKLNVEALKNRVPVSSGAKLRDLHESRVLQYMDVSQYHQIMNKLSGGDYQNKYEKTPDAEMGRIIFSDYRGRDYKDKMKTTKKHLYKLTRDKAYIAAMSARP